MSPRTWKQWGFHSNQSLPSIVPCRPGMSQPGYLSFGRPWTHWTRYKVYYYHWGNAYLVPFLSTIVLSKCCFLLWAPGWGEEQQDLIHNLVLLLWGSVDLGCPDSLYVGINNPRLTAFIFSGSVCSSKLRMPPRLKGVGLTLMYVFVLSGFAVLPSLPGDKDYPVCSKK